MCVAQRNTLSIEKYSISNDTGACQYECEMETSYVNDFELICKNENLQQFIGMYFFIPSMIGGLLSGPIMDGFGRKTAFVLFGLSALVTEIGNLIFLAMTSFLRQKAFFPPFLNLYKI